MFIGGCDMLRTITLGTAVFVQGVFVRSLPGGRIQVRVGDQTYSGIPVKEAA